ncbi:nuclear transport factor 2 family protein [Actinomadura sp. B10D3]|uniref:nuclear transport factor 2 family protein n=1 Tax=Actinomadura sp. B10D3 TaxID=3153557 RepID=UPI00325E95A2
MPQTFIDIHRLQNLLDKDEIRELLFRYAEYVDRKQFADWAACFTEDVRITMPFASHEGQEGLEEWGRNGLSHYEVTEHLYGNIQIVVNGDHATGRSNFWAACTNSRADLTRHFDEGGSYTWEFERGAQGWRISRLDLDVTWTTGDDETGLSG